MADETGLPEIDPEQSAEAQLEAIRDLCRAWPDTSKSGYARLGRTLYFWFQTPALTDLQC